MRNGMIQITSRYREEGSEHVGSAHVHSYGTSALVQEIRSGAAKQSDYRLTIDDEAPCITIEHVEGNYKGRRFVFEPIHGDDTGWSEMLEFARAIQAIWHAGYRVL